MDNNPTYPTQQHSPHDQSSARREEIKSLLSTLGVFLLAPIVAFILTIFVFQSYEVDGPSMESALHNKDRLIVLKLPQTWAKLRNQSYVPERGEIIVFSKSELKEGIAAGAGKQLIKRVVGIPGDKIIIKDGGVTVYNSDHTSGFRPDQSFKDASDISETTSGDVELTVKDGQVFVLGDNRGNSLDSRYFGVVHSDEIVGRLSFRIYPFNTFKKY